MRPYCTLRPPLSLVRPLRTFQRKVRGRCQTITAQAELGNGRGMNDLRIDHFALSMGTC